MQNENAETYTLRVETDSMPPDPRKDYDNFGKMICWHRNYNLGDEHDFKDGTEFLESLVRKSLSANEIIDFVKKGGSDEVSLKYDRSQKEWVLSSCNNAFEKWYTEYTFSPKTLKGSDMVKECILECLPDKDLKELADRNNVILPLYIYDHSGVTISCELTYPYNDRWDSSMVGWIYASYEDIQKEYGTVTPETIEKAKDTLVDETKLYDNYLQGYCYGYVIEKDGVAVENCWGFTGDLREILSEMKSNANGKYRHLFDNIDYGCMEYTEKIPKPSVKEQLAGLKSQIKDTVQTSKHKTQAIPEI